jgi:hypothetical protein
MTLPDQLSPLSASKRLKELGVVQDKAHYYYQWDELYPAHLIDFGNPHIAAFTVAELGVMLEEHSEGIWRGEVNYFFAPNMDDIREFETEASARSAYLIHLLETGVLTVEEVNKRL